MRYLIIIALCLVLAGCGSSKGNFLRIKHYPYGCFEDGSVSYTTWDMRHSELIYSMIADFYIDKYGIERYELLTGPKSNKLEKLK